MLLSGLYDLFCAHCDILFSRCLFVSGVETHGHGDENVLSLKRRLYDIKKMQQSRSLRRKSNQWIDRNISHRPNNDILSVTTLCFIFWCCSIHLLISWQTTQGLCHTLRVIELTFLFGLEVIYRGISWQPIRRIKFIIDIWMVSFTVVSRRCWPLRFDACVLDERVTPLPSCRLHHHQLCQIISLCLLFLGPFKWLQMSWT